MGRNAGSRKEGKAEKIPNDIMVQRMSNTASGRLKKIEPLDTKPPLDRAIFWHQTEDRRAQD